MYEEIIERWIGTVRRWALAVTLAALAITLALAAYTARTLTINTDTEDMISSEVSFRKNDLTFKRAFPQFKDFILAVIEGAGAGGAAGRLAVSLRRHPKQILSVYTPGEEPYFQKNGLLLLGTEELGRLVDRLASAEPILAALARDPSMRGLGAFIATALSERKGEGTTGIEELLNRLADAASGKGRFAWQSLIAGESSRLPKNRRFVIIHPALDYGSLKPASSAIALIRRAAKEARITPAHGLRLRLTGPIALEQEELDSVELGSMVATALSFSLVLFLLIWSLRSALLIFATVATLIAGLIWTAAFAAFAIGELNLISIAFAVLYIGLGVDFGIHMALRFREQLALSAGSAAALQRAAKGVGPGLGLSALAAGVGFFSFWPTAYKGIAELGMIAGVGMFIALFANLSVLPAILSLAGARKPPGRSFARSSRYAFLIHRLRRPIFGTTLLLAVSAAAVAPSVRFDFNPLNLKDPDSESVATFIDLATDPRTSPYTINILVKDAASAKVLARRLEALPEVGSAITIGSFMPKAQEEKLRLLDEAAIFLTPALAAKAVRPPPSASARARVLTRLRKNLAKASGGKNKRARAAARLDAALARIEGDEARLAALDKQVAGQLPELLGQLRLALSAKRVHLSDIPPAIRSRWVAKDGRARIELRPAGSIAGNGDIRRFSKAVLAMAPSATGTPVIITEAGDAVVKAFLQASVLSFVLISMILLFVMRRLIDIAMVLAPLALAALLTAAFSVLLGLPFNFANVIVLPLLLGLGVSNGIHLVMRRRQEGDSQRVLASSTSRAVLYSALTTISAFGSLALSGHPGMTSMGLLLTIAISFTLCATLIVLPSWMFLLEDRHGRERETAKP